MTSSSASFTAHAPGTLMLMGEHAVLHGRPALCMAVSQRMQLVLKKRADRNFTIQSALGAYAGELGDIEVCKPYTFVLEAIRRAAPCQGFDLKIHSEFSSTIGFGSSAAVTVSLVALLRHLAGHAFDRASIFSESLSVVRSVQGTASGSDVAAAVYGGVVHYRADPLQLEPLHCQLPLSVCYVGYKTPTPEVIGIVDTLRGQHPARFEELFTLIGNCVGDALAALRQGDLAELGRLFNLHQGCQSALGCSDGTLEYLIYQLRAQAGIHGAKISGSGLGDCVIALGNAEAKVNGYDHFPIQTASEGVSLEF
ncbi:mevalonate kinase [Kiritimatiellaeota bacterium B1221]|nr:mevalonate kinase [Kiritimatiellaeota bacterium B1221]